MPDKKLPDSEIIKALEEAKYRVDGVELKGFYLDPESFNRVVDLFNRLQAENERLKSCVKTEKEVREIAKRTMEPLVKEITREQIDIAVKLAKIEAYKECIEKVKEKSCKLNMCHNDVVIKTDYQISGESLNNLLKEKLKELKGND